MRTAHRRRGFSLVEIVVSMGLLGIGVAAGIQLFDATARSTMHTRSKTSSMQLAEERLEYLGTRDLSDLPSCAGTADCRAGVRTYNPALTASGGYQCTQYAGGQAILDPYDAASTGMYRIDTIIEAHPDPTREPNARLITVSVCWTDERGNVQQVQERRLIAYDNDV
jgi:prepilin-type N-terminal cleavage/methylation domain-containing protein